MELLVLSPTSTRGGTLEDFELSENDLCVCSKQGKAGCSEGYRHDRVPPLQGAFTGCTTPILQPTQREALSDEVYDVIVDTTLAPRHLDFAQSRLRDECVNEIFFSTTPRWGTKSSPVHSSRPVSIARRLAHALATR